MSFTLYFSLNLCSPEIPDLILIYFSVSFFLNLPSESDDVASIKEGFALLQLHKGRPECVFVLQSILGPGRQLGWVVASVEWICDQVSEVFMLLELLHVDWVLVLGLRLEFGSSFSDEIFTPAVRAGLATGWIS